MGTSTSTDRNAADRRSHKDAVTPERHRTPLPRSLSPYAAAVSSPYSADDTGDLTPPTAWGADAVYGRSLASTGPTAADRESIAPSGVFDLPPVPAVMPADIERAGLIKKLATVAALRIGLVTLAMGASFALLDLESSRSIDDVSLWQYTLIAAAYAISLIYALGLRFGRQIEVMAYAQILVDSLLVTWLVLMTGGSESVFSFAYVFVVFGSAMTLYRRGAILATMFSLLFFGTMVTLQVEKIVPFLPALPASTATLSFFMYTIGLSLLAVLASTLAETARARGAALAAKESEFERLEELHASILRSLPAGLMTVDPGGTVRYVNEAALAILRYRNRDVIGKALRVVVPSVAEPWSVFLKQNRIPNPRERFEGNFIRFDGTNIRLGFSFAPLSTDPDEFGLMVVFQDVTDIVRLKEAVERSERLASIGKLAAGLAHEVRNPLASMCASIDVLKGALTPPEPMQRLMTNIVTEGDRLNHLITDFLDFARPRKLDVQRGDISALVSSVVDVFKNDPLFAGCKLVLSVERGLIAEFDNDAIRQVVWNLGRNAVQAIQGQPRSLITIITRSSEDFAEIVVRDSGVGIPADQVNRIFDPFFTTKNEGTGLGLAIAHSIVQAHAGKVLVSSEKGVGTEFVVSLPRVDALRYDPSPDETDPSLNVTPSNFEVLIP